MPAISKISPFLWFESRAEEAANFYVSIFENSRILSVTKVAAGPAKDGALVEFELEGQKFSGIDGGPMFSFTPAVSFVVTCDSQEEIDYFWEKLSEGWNGSVGRLAERQVRPVLAGGTLRAGGNNERCPGAGYGAPDDYDQDRYRAAARGGNKLAAARHTTR